MDGIYVIVSAVIGASATIASVLISRKRAKDIARKKDPILSETQNNENIYTALDYLMNQMGADRAYIMQFHNGSYYVSGRSQQKFSCTHEMVLPGISREHENSRNHIVSNFHDYINKLTSDGSFAYSDVKSAPDHAFAMMAQDKGVKSIYNVPIKTLNDTVIGILGVDYVKGYVDECSMDSCASGEGKCFDKTTNEFMRRQARIIAGYLI
jgi:hypothetical protein